MSTIQRQTLSEREAAHYIGLSPSTLRHGRCYRAVGQRMATPPYVKAGRKVLYRLADLDGWLSAHAIGKEHSHAH